MRRDFVANLFAESVERHAVGEQVLTQLVDREVVLPRDLFDRGIHHLVVDSDAGLTGALHDRAFRDETFEHLTAQVLHRRKRNVLASEIDRHRVNALLKLVLGDDVRIDDGYDAVHFDGSRGSCGRGSGFGGRAGHDACRLSGAGQECAERDGENLQRIIHSSHRGW